MSFSDEPMDRPVVSTRDHVATERALGDWFGSKVTDPVVRDFTVPGTNGMSSDTLLFDVEYGPPDDRTLVACVLRMPPSGDAMPVFPIYDLGKQAAVMELAGRGSGIPVPAVLWYESDPSHLGAEFIVMQRINGRVPPDVMPYVFPGNWLLDESTDEQRAHLQRRTVELLAALHNGDYSPDALAALGPHCDGDSALRRHVNDQRAYYEWTVEGRDRSPLIEAVFAHLDATWPTAAADRPSVLSWGDSRIGNIMYGRRYEPVAVLDWEMAACGPREIDLGWLIYMHTFFQSIADIMGMVGLPTFLQRDDVVGQYAAASGVAVQNIAWFEQYAALRYAVVALRIGYRQVHFGERELPENTDDLIMNAAALHAMLS